MTNNDDRIRALAHIAGAQALLNQALAVLGGELSEVEVDPGDCPHPMESAENLGGMGQPEQPLRCGICGAKFTRPWPDEDS